MASTDVNVRVAVRCRPMNTRESQLGAQCIVQVVDGATVMIRSSLDEGSTTSPRPPDDPTNTVKQFTFDHAYFIDSTQQQVYNDVARPIIDQALQGYNGTIFAYGQTGSGKTHTMMGTLDDPGIIPQMNEDLFKRIAQATNETTKFLVTVSFLEIYNEVIKDLLNPSDKLLKIREHPDMGIYVEQLAELVVKEPSDVTRLIAQGNKVRQVAATQMNERSSRSHSCFTIKIASKQTTERNGLIKEICVNAKINLVDLAGSERASKTGATGDRLKEGAAINKSLSALGNVITLLATSKGTAKDKHIPYRDSKLTRLLQESLGGNSLTVMVAAISPADDNYEESLGTLQYANRAKSIKNATKKNEDINEKIIRELREEIERLRQMVVRPPSATGGFGGGDMMQRMEETIANLERAKQDSWEEKQRLTEQFEQERQTSLNNDHKILGFMQTVKQEKMDLMKKIKTLQQQKLQVSKTMRLKKQQYGINKTKLQQLVEEYQQNGTKPTNEQWNSLQKQRCMENIENHKRMVMSDRDELVRLKEELQGCEDQLVEEESEVAAKSALLEEDEKLRRVIQNDEREKMKQEREAYLQQALEDERRELQRVAEEEKNRLELVLSATADKEKELMEEVERQRSKALQMQQQMSAMTREHMEWKAQTKNKLTEMIENIKQSFTEEQNALQTKYEYAVNLLRIAREDILLLSQQNQALEQNHQQLVHQLSNTTEFLQQKQHKEFFIQW